MEPNLLPIRRFFLDLEAAPVLISPNNDGKLIRLAIPALTEERRRDLTKVVRKHVEFKEAKIK